MWLWAVSLTSCAHGCFIPGVSLALVSLPKEFTYAALSFFGCLCILVKKMGNFRDSCQSCSALDVGQKHLSV